MTSTTMPNPQAVGRAVHWRGPQVCAVAEISYRQLDYWARTGVLVPTVAAARGSGTQRLYSTADVAAATLLSKLSKFGCRLSSVASVVAQLQTTRLDLWPSWVVVTCDGFLIELADALTAESGDLDVCWLVNLRRVVDDVELRAVELLG